MRSYPEPIFPTARPLRADIQPAAPADSRLTLLLAVTEADLNFYSGSQYIRVPARTTAAALQQISRHPSLVVVDWDLEGLDSTEVCRAASATGASVLVSLSDPASAPAAIKSGCHAILLKPFAPMLVAARLGRLAREQADRARFPAMRAAPLSGTHRPCPETDCPYCARRTPVIFEFCSHRRAWYACLSCEKVWLGVRLE